MSYSIRSFILVGLAALLGIAGCKKETTQPQQDPLVGTWALSNMEQTRIVKAAKDYSQTLGFPEGYTLVDTTVGWNVFQMLGVSMTVDLKDDHTFAMTGNLPVASDTLGQDLMVLPVTDQGTWNAPEDLSTFTLDGAFYAIAGTLSVNNPESPTMIALFYTQAAQDTVVLPKIINQELNFFDVVVEDSSATTLEFTKQ